MAIRSGRFSYENSTTDASYILVRTKNKKGSGTIYRVFNSSGCDLTVRSGSNQTVLQPDCSLDVMIVAGEDLTVSWTIPKKDDGMGNMVPVPTNIRCSYNYLGDENSSGLEALGDLRSGRYSAIPTNAGNNNVIVDLRAGTTAFYRLMNSGQADVILEVTGSGMSNIGDITVEPGFSKDVAIGRNGQIKLKDSAKPVDVIYDLLGGIEA